MDCRQARQLFDAYLDGELSPTLATELGAHRVHCAACRRELALLEVTGHIIASDRDEVLVEDDFTDRLLACMPAPRRHWLWQARRRLYVAVPLAAAAVVALGFFGVFRGSSSDVRIAGMKVEADRELVDLLVEPPKAVAEPAAPNPDAAQVRELDEMFRRMRESLSAKKQAGESVQHFFDLSILQLLSIVDSVEPTSEDQAEGNTDEDAVPENAYDDVPADDGEIEDL